LAKASKERRGERRNQEEVRREERRYEWVR